MLWISLIGPPSPPQDVIVGKVGRSYVELRWDKPRSDGGSKITGMISINFSNLFDLPCALPLEELKSTAMRRHLHKSLILLLLFNWKKKKWHFVLL